MGNPIGAEAIPAFLTVFDIVRNQFLGETNPTRELFPENIKHNQGPYPLISLGNTICDEIYIYILMHMEVLRNIHTDTGL